MSNSNVNNAIGRSSIVEAAKFFLYMYEKVNSSSDLEDIRKLYLEIMNNAIKQKYINIMANEINRVKGNISTTDSNAMTDMANEFSEHAKLGIVFNSTSYDPTTYPAHIVSLSIAYPYMVMFESEIVGLYDSYIEANTDLINIRISNLKYDDTNSISIFNIRSELDKLTGYKSDKVRRNIDKLSSRETMRLLNSYYDQDESKIEQEKMLLDTDAIKEEEMKEDKRKYLNILSFNTVDVYDRLITIVNDVVTSNIGKYTIKNIVDLATYSQNINIEKPFDYINMAIVDVEEELGYYNIEEEESVSDHYIGFLSDIVRGSGMAEELDLEEELSYVIGAVADIAVLMDSNSVTYVELLDEILTKMYYANGYEEEVDSYKEIKTSDNNVMILNDLSINISTYILDTIEKIKGYSIIDDEEEINYVDTDEDDICCDEDDDIDELLEYFEMITVVVNNEINDDTHIDVIAANVCIALAKIAANGKMFIITNSYNSIILNIANNNITMINIESKKIVAADLTSSEYDIHRTRENLIGYFGQFEGDELEPLRVIKHSIENS